jgi:hypothetical protein
MKMEQTECSETSAHQIQTMRNHPKERIQHSEHSENLNSRIKNTSSLKVAELIMMGSTKN